MSFRNVFLTTGVLLFLIACGSDSNNHDDSYNGTPETSVNNVVKGQAMQGYGSRVEHDSTVSYYYATDDTDIDFINECHEQYGEMWENLEPDKEVNNEVFNITREYQGSRFIAENIDQDDNLLADLNVIAGNLPDMPYVGHINLDVNCDGIANVNLDTTGNGLPDTNIDETGNGVGDYSLGSGSITSVQGATVELVGVGSRNGAENFTTSTAEDGNFEIENVRAGDYEIIIRKNNNGFKAWARDVISISPTDEQDLGQFTLSTTPYINNLESDFVDFGIDANNSKGVGYGGIDTIFTVGDSYSFTIDIIDPNNDTIFYKLPDYSHREDGGIEKSYRRIAGDEVVDENGDLVFRFDIKVVLKESYYEYHINDKVVNKVPLRVRGESLIAIHGKCDIGLYLDDCDEPPIFNWREVERLTVHSMFVNSDGVYEQSGSDSDISINFWLENEDYDYDYFDEEIEVYSITVNGSVHTNPEPKEDLIVDIGNIEDLNYIELSVDVEESSSYESVIAWHTPIESDANIEIINENTIRVSVDDFKKIYGSQPFGASVFFVDDSGTFSAEGTIARLEYDVSGERQPAQCERIIVNGSENDHPIYQPGDALRIEAVVSDPNGLPTEYWVVTESGKDITGGYISSNEMSRHVLESNDIRDSFKLIVRCKNNDGYGIYESNGMDDIQHVSIPVSY